MLILLIFRNVASLGLGKFLPVNNLITFDVSAPVILTTAMPEIPGPLYKAKIVMN